MTYYSTKTYEHLGSTAFRQWRAQSHCNLLHGYSFTVTFTFGADELDRQNFVVDFGALKSLKALLEQSLDHTVLVAADDPHLDWFKAGDKNKTCRIVIVDRTGCESMAEMIFSVAEQWLLDAGFSPRAWLEKVEVREHGANSAFVTRKKITDRRVDNRLRRFIRGEEAN